MSLVEAEPAIQDGEGVLQRAADQRLLPRAGCGVDGLPDRVGSIRFEGVGFAYETGPKVIEGLDLEIAEGSSLALVGPTGGGKTTIANLLCRFYEPVGGRITYDGRDVTERSLAWLASRVTVVPQTPHLFRGSVLENVRYGKLDANDDEVRSACQAVGLQPFVERLEAGYDTDVGEGGTHLSAGERQLVSIARALLADPQVLVLDEATSAIDSGTEEVCASRARAPPRGPHVGDHCAPVDDDSRVGSHRADRRREHRRGR